MNEALKSRLIGALVLLGAALILAFLLPRPDRLVLDEGARRVTIDLHEPGAAAEVANAAQLTPPVIAAPEPLPSTVEAAENAAVAEPRIEEPAEASTGLRMRQTESLAPPPVAAHEDLSSPRAPPLRLKAADHLEASRDAVVPPQAATAAVAPATTAAPTAPAPKPEARTDARSELKPEAAPKPAPKPAPPPALKPAPPETVALAPPPPSAASPAPAPAPATGAARWSVQVGSFSDVKNARQAESRIRGAGLPCVVALIDTAKGKLYRVRIAPLGSESQAAAARAKAQALGFDAATVRQD